MPIKIVAMTTLSTQPGANEALEKYLNVVGPLMQLAGAQLVHRLELGDSVAGATEYQFITLVEYPSSEAVSQVFESKEYLALEEVKQVAFSHYVVSKIAG